MAAKWSNEYVVAEHKDLQAMNHLIIFKQSKIFMVDNSILSDTG